jgi:soluble lytic murein transglycosylase-like protein
MNYRNLYYAFVVFVLLVTTLYEVKEIVNINKLKSIEIPRAKITSSAPPCLRMYDAIIKYSNQYAIPKRYAFGIAYLETRYEGPFQWRYQHTQTSSVGAIGPMQIMPSTARLMWKRRNFDNQQLMNDIDFNVHTSMKLLRNLHDKYGDWKIVFGCYNTGRPMINDYAVHVYNHKIRWNITNL